MATNKLASLVVAPADRARDNNINLIRFVAASMVILGHMAHLTGAPSIPSVCGQEVSSLAVKVFFVLSGYLIAQSFLRDPHPFRYLVRRTFRIFPALVFVVLVSAFFMGPLLTRLAPAEYFANGKLWEYLLNCVLNLRYTLPGVFENNPWPDAFNGSLWTLPVEFAMYLVLPFFLVLLRTPALRKGGLVVLAVGTSVLSLLSMTGVVDLDYVVWGSRISDGMVLVPYFFIGSLAVYPRVRRLFNPQVAFLLFALVAGIDLGASWKVETLVLLCLPYITFSIALAAPAAFGRFFAEHDYSYGVYLWAFPVQQTLVHFLGADAFGLVGYSLVAFAATLPCAMVSWFAVERPANRLARRLTSWSRGREEARRARRERGAHV